MANDNIAYSSLIAALPDILAEARSRAEEGWSGSTASMMQSSYDVIDVLQSMWLRLADKFPPWHFGKKTHEEYIQTYIQDRFAWHRATAEPDGVGTGGTIVGPIAAGGVMGDMERMVEQIVQAMFNRGITDNEMRSYEHWLTAWRKVTGKRD